MASRAPKPFIIRISSKFVPLLIQGGHRSHKGSNREIEDREIENQEIEDREIKERKTEWPFTSRAGFASPY